MTVQVEFWQLITLLISFLGFLFAAGKLLLSQIDRRLNDRFEAMENAREQASRHWDEKFGTVIDQNRREAEGWQPWSGSSCASRPICRCSTSAAKTTSGAKA